MFIPLNDEVVPHVGLYGIRCSSAHVCVCVAWACVQGAGRMQGVRWKASVGWAPRERDVKEAFVATSSNGEAATMFDCSDGWVLAPRRARPNLGHRRACACTGRLKAWPLAGIRVVLSGGTMARPQCLGPAAKQRRRGGAATVQPQRAKHRLGGFGLGGARTRAGTWRSWATA